MDHKVSGKITVKVDCVDHQEEVFVEVLSAFRFILKNFS